MFVEFPQPYFMCVCVLRFSQDWRHVGDYGIMRHPFVLSCLALLSCTALKASVWESVYGLHESVYVSAC